jgi:oligopeptide/dipeptide ABC transporter ATP-binding protein
MNRSLAAANGTPADRANGSELLDVRELVVHYRPPALLRKNLPVVHAVDGISFTIDRGETLGLVGESGCGKTTVGRAIARLVHTTSGSILFNGQNIEQLSRGELRKLRKGIQVIAQDATGSLDPRMRIEDLIAEPLIIHRVGTRTTRRGRVEELLHHVGLPRDLLNSYPHQVSGGQRQRIVVARALALEPRLIIADEPTSALDVSVQAQIVNLMGSLQHSLGLSYLFISHNLPVVRTISRTVAVMYLGQIVEHADANDLYHRPKHPYTIALLTAVPEPDPTIERERPRVGLRGDVPSPRDPPSGCRFHTRCWLYRQLGSPKICAEQTPTLNAAGQTHHVACHFTNEAQHTFAAEGGLSTANGSLVQPHQTTDRKETKQ